MADVSVNGDLALQAELPVLIRSAGALARHCDRAEHNEQVERATILTAGAQLRGMAWRLTRAFDTDLQQRYADRLEALESRHPHYGDGRFDGGGAVRASKTLLDLQRAQLRHDEVYHGDVAGLPKYLQLRHFTLHLTKLVEKLLDAIEGRHRDVFVSDGVIDVFIFGIKLSTVAGERLSEEVIDAA